MYCIDSLYGIVKWSWKIWDVYALYLFFRIWICIQLHKLSQLSLSFLSHSASIANNINYHAVTFINECFFIPDRSYFWFLCSNMFLIFVSTAAILFINVAIITTSKIFFFRNLEAFLLKLSFSTNSISVAYNILHFCSHYLFINVFPRTYDCTSGFVQKKLTHFSP